MKRTLICELEGMLGENVKLNGWVHRVRKLKSITFVILRDRSGMVQCVVDNKNMMSLKCESVIEVKGTVREGKNSLHKYEVAVESLRILSIVNEDLPIEVNADELNVSLDTMLNNRVLSLRNPKKNAIFKIQHLIVEGFREYLSREGFTEIFSPKIVAEGAEGGTSLFKLDYFGTDAYLAKSPQFYKQMMVAAGYERVFEIAGFFRAEEHDKLKLSVIEGKYAVCRLPNSHRIPEWAVNSSFFSITKTHDELSIVCSEKKCAGRYHM